MQGNREGSQTELAIGPYATYDTRWPFLLLASAQAHFGNTSSPAGSTGNRRFARDQELALRDTSFPQCLQRVSAMVSRRTMKAHGVVIPTK
jgi:hypothetical protein